MREYFYVTKFAHKNKRMIKDIISIILWLIYVVILSVIGILSWVFHRKPKARCPKCGRKMKKHDDESFGVWTCNKCNNVKTNSHGKNYTV